MKTLALGTLLAVLATAAGMKKLPEAIAAVKSAGTNKTDLDAGFTQLRKIQAINLDTPDLQKSLDQAFPDQEPRRDNPTFASEGDRMLYEADQLTVQKEQAAGSLRKLLAGITGL